jgi:cytochrome c oxidase subunit III
MSDASALLHEPWPDLRLQREGVSFGVWVFLASEVLFFGGLFLGYTVYRNFNAEAFRLAASHTEIVYGTINTGLLLTSSMTMTIALRAATVGMRQTTLILLAVTLALGIAFLATKGLEYASDLEKHLFPGPEFPLSPPAAQLFWAYYWVMTGIHAVHLSGGIIVVAAVSVLYWRRIIPVQGSTMAGVATYWHFVDAIWLVLFPLLYLVGRS